MPDVSLASFRIGNDQSLTWIAGPCVIEEEAFTVALAKRLVKLSKKHRMPYVFKASYDKANRSAITSFRGPKLLKGLAILQRVREEVGCPVLTDIHSVPDAIAAAKVVDIIQIPAFLCRQTDLLLACGDTGKVVNIKKGQFMAPWDMENAVRKIESTGNRQILLTERGASFGYNNLVVDMRSLAVMKQFGYPVIYDATHSVQLPGGLKTSSGGQREFVIPLARAAVGLGVAGLFTEVHPRPEHALSDGPNSLAESTLPVFLKTMMALDRISKTL